MFTAIPRYGARVLPDTARILDTIQQHGQEVDGPHIRAFERAFAARLGVPDARATSWGRMAFFHLLHALQLPPGSEIVLPSLTFWVVPELARVAGLEVVFCDVDPLTFTMDPASLARVITPRTRAVVPTHLWGMPCDMDAINAIARQHGLAVIEDCAHAHGTFWRGRGVGSFGSFGSFSFQQSKLMTAGEGGALIGSDAALMARARAYMNCGRVPGGGPYEHWAVGSNVRMTEWQGAVLSAQLARFPAHVSRTPQIAPVDSG